MAESPRADPPRHAEEEIEHVLRGQGGSAEPAGSNETEDRPVPDQTGADDGRTSQVGSAASELGSFRGLASSRSDGRSLEITWRRKGRHILTSIEFQLFMTCVILVDVGAFAAEAYEEAAGIEPEVQWHMFMDVFTLSLYVVEIVLKLICFDWNFFRDVWNVFDLLIVVLSAALIHFGGGIVVVARLGKLGMRVVKCTAKSFRVVLRVKPVVSGARTKVSKNKMRLRDFEHNFDLDLTYIDEPTLIAMGVPATGFLNRIVRNNLYEVARFFQVNHRGHFRVYNLCPEMPYSDVPFKKVGGDVRCFVIQDHCPPRMEQLIEFLQDARRFFTAHNKNTIVVHCKAGKGRTGTLCCAWLLYSRRQASPKDALEYFAVQRTDTSIGRKLRGVETPSQIRYVQQLFTHLVRTDSWLDSPRPPPSCPAPTVILHCLSINGDLFVKPADMVGVQVLVQCFEGSDCVAVLETAVASSFTKTFPLEDARVKGDVRIALFEPRGSNASAKGAVAAAKQFMDAEGLLAYFCFHTDFLHPEQPRDPWDCCGTFDVDVSEMDKANKKVREGETAAAGRKGGSFNEGSGLSLQFFGDFFGGGARPHGPRSGRGGSPEAGAEAAATSAASEAASGQGHRGSCTPSGAPPPLRPPPCPCPPPPLPPPPLQLECDPQI